MMGTKGGDDGDVVAVVHAFALLLAHAWMVVPVGSSVVGVPDQVADAYWINAVLPWPRTRSVGVFREFVEPSPFALTVIPPSRQLTRHPEQRRYATSLLL